jgi:hypothetical protein
METHRAYCAALDREVRVYLRPVLCNEREPDVAYAPGLVCLEHAEECTGMMCPLFYRPEHLPAAWLHAGRGRRGPGIAPR